MADNGFVAEQPQVSNRQVETGLLPPPLSTSHPSTSTSGNSPRRHRDCFRIALAILQRRVITRCFPAAKLHSACCRDKLHSYISLIAVVERRSCGFRLAADAILLTGSCPWEIYSTGIVHIQVQCPRSAYPSPHIAYCWPRASRYHLPMTAT